MTLPVELRSGAGVGAAGCSAGGAGVGRSLTEGAGGGVGGPPAAGRGVGGAGGGGGAAAGDGAWAAAGTTGAAGSGCTGRGIGVGVDRTTRCGAGSGATGSGATDGATGSGAGRFEGRTRVAVGFGSGVAASTGAACLRSPSESARRRTRSAKGSSMLDEWLLTPIFSRSHRSSTTWFSTPSSRASS
jgi:hypothetical protein